MRQLKTRRSRGLTLIELMVGLAIASMLMLAAMPYFGEYTANSRLRENGNTVYTDALLAQSEAIKRNRLVRLVSNGSRVQVLDLSNPDTPTVLRERVLEGVSTGELSIDFGSAGRPVPFGTSGSLDFAIPGQTCSGDIRCPGLRIDAGGGVRLCGNNLDNCS
jgi:type IV fimbrial biogenesis protein FimT